MLKRYFESLRLICGNANARKVLHACLKTVLIQIILCCACLAIVFALFNAIAILIDSLRYSYHTTAETLQLTALLVLCLLLVFVVALLAGGFAVGLATLVSNGVHASLDKLILNQWEESDHGQTMAEVVTRIHNLPVEYCAVFDDDGVKISEGTIFSRQSCHIPITHKFEAMPYYGGVAIHNHPGSSDVAFSPCDFATAVANGFRKSIVATSKLIYTLEISEETAEEVDYEELQQDVEAVFNAVNSTPDNIFMMWGSGNIAAWYGACQAIACQYGMTLTVEKLAECPYIKEYRKTRWQTFLKKVFGFYAEPDEVQPAECLTEMVMASPETKKNKKR